MWMNLYLYYTRQHVQTTSNKSKCTWECTDGARKNAWNDRSNGSIQELHINIMTRARVNVFSPIPPISSYLVHFEVCSLILKWSALWIVKKFTKMIDRTLANDRRSIWNWLNRQLLFTQHFGRQCINFFFVFFIIICNGQWHLCLSLTLIAYSANNSTSIQMIYASVPVG